MLSHWHNQYSIFMHPDLPMIPDRGDRWLMAVLFIHVFFLTFSAFFHLFFFFFFFFFPSPFGACRAHIQDRSANFRAPLLKCNN